MASNVKHIAVIQSYHVLLPQPPQNDEDRSGLIYDQRNHTYQKNIKARRDISLDRSIDRDWRLGFRYNLWPVVKWTNYCSTQPNVAHPGMALACSPIHYPPSTHLPTQWRTSSDYTHSWVLESNTSEFFVLWTEERVLTLSPSILSRMKTHPTHWHNDRPTLFR